MFWKVKNGRLSLCGGEMDYVCFGRGERVLLMLPGLGDGLRTVRGMAAVMALSYRIYVSDCRVYIFSRKSPLAEGCTTRDMARDTAQALRALGIGRAAVLGISQGGMIAQYLALDYPELVEALVLANTSPGPNEDLISAVSHWMASARRGDYRALMEDTAERSYSESYLKKYRRLYPLLGRLGRPKDFGRFLIQAASCMEHDARGELSRITCPCLVIGGAADKIVGPDAAPALAAAINGSELHIYETLGHAAYEEAPDFHKRVLSFITKNR